MKIGILTFQYSVNFGAQLQCLALQEIIKEMGHDVEVINYMPDLANNPIYRGIGLKENGLLKSLFILCVRILYGKKMVKRFSDFKNMFFKQTDVCNKDSISSKTSKFDIIIVGSDQVWGSSFHNVPIYFVGWIPEFKGRRVSYAPCCAVNKVLDENKENIINLLNKFDSISVRNTETQNFVNDLIHVKYPMVLDPTFLYDFSQFKDSLQVPHKKYILAYVIGKEIKGGHQKMINEIKKVIGDLPVVSIMLSESKVQYFSWVDKTYWSINPIEWISLIAKADFFYTDSFHGAVFGFKFKTNFLAYYVDENRKSRFVDLSERFNLESHIIESVDDALERNCIRENQINDQKTQIFVENEILNSIKFLKDALK